MAKNTKIKADLIGSFNTIQNEVKIFSTNLKWNKVEIFICKTTILHQATNGKKGSIRYGNRQQIISILKSYKNSVQGTNKTMLHMILWMLGGNSRALEEPGFSLDAALAMDGDAK